MKVSKQLGLVRALALAAGLTVAFWTASAQADGACGRRVRTCGPQVKACAEQTACAEKQACDKEAKAACDGEVKAACDQ